MVAKPTLRAAPSASPYNVDSVPVGSYFHFRVVLRTRPADLASVEVYTYAPTATKTAWR